ncbi:MAG TPA: hypothetical protein PLF26_15320 [Blastocatellia bacterium]|nr:hypothetical protein [Blastocatellia bacterium]
MPILWVAVAAAFVLRLFALKRFWRLPEKLGAGWVFATRIDDGSSVDALGILVRRYRSWLFLPVGVDVIAIALLVATNRLLLLAYEQLAAVVAMSVFCNLAAVHFAQRAKMFAATPEPSRVEAFQVSLESRRLRDHTNWILETVCAVLCTVAIIVTLALGEGISVVVWLAYLQIGLLLLKQLFVRGRMRLPANRADDARRWRDAWLAYHVRVFDAVRVAFASVMLVFAASDLGDKLWSIAALGPVVLGVVVTIVAVMTVYCIRERKRFAVVEREINPAELARELPSMPLPDGRFLAGGLLVVSPGSPVALTRGPRGIAINLASRTTVLWALYAGGFVALAVWQARG